MTLYAVALGFGYTFTTLPSGPTSTERRLAFS